MTRIDYLQSFLDQARVGYATMQLTQENIDLIQKSIKQWLTLKKRLDDRLLTRYKQLSKETVLGRVSSKGKDIDLSAGGLTQVLNYYTENKRRVRTLMDMDQITQLFKDGYELIHRIREFLTKQELTYSILYSPTSKGESGEELMEVNFTLDQLLSSVRLATSDMKEVAAGSELTNATQLLIQGPAVKQTLKEIEKKEQNLLTVLHSLDKPGLWNSLVAFRDARQAKYKGNLGQLYEVYSIMRRDPRYTKINYIGHEKGKANTINFAELLLTEAIQNNDPGWQIGDVGTEQMKSVANGAASLISTSTIEKTLKEISQAFSGPIDKDMENSLKNIFLTNRTSFNNEMDRKAEEEALRALEEMFNNI